MVVVLFTQWHSLRHSHIRPRFRLGNLQVDRWTEKVPGLVVWLAGWGSALRTKRRGRQFTFCLAGVRPELPAASANGS